MSAPIIGIDLGTCNSVVAVADPSGNVQVLADKNGFKVQPSVVSFHPSGSVIVGAEAKQRRIIDPNNTIYSVKRLIGRPYRAPEVAALKQRVPYVIREGANQQPLIATRAGELTVPEISAMVLDHLRTLAQERLGVPVERAVITVPANFTDAQRQATATAGAIAGLDVPRVLSEPTAAALAYGHRRPLDQTIVVYDFGGGTFDVTVLQLQKDVYEVLGTAGDSFLGGDDIDERVVDTMVQLFLEQNRIDLRGDQIAMQRLRSVAEQTKIELARRTRALIKIEEIAYGKGGTTLDFELEMTRESLVAHAADIVERTFPVCEEALRMAGLTAKRIDDVVLVGGTTKMPYVRERVTQFFGKAPRTDVSPDEAIATGAALQAFALSRILGPASRNALPAGSDAGAAAADTRRPPGSDAARTFLLEERTQIVGQLAATGSAVPAISPRPPVPSAARAETLEADQGDMLATRSRPRGAPALAGSSPVAALAALGKEAPGGSPARSLSSAPTREVQLGPTSKWPRTPTDASGDIELPEPSGVWQRPSSELAVEIELPEPSGVWQRPVRDPSHIDLPPAPGSAADTPHSAYSPQQPYPPQTGQARAFDSGALTIDRQLDFVAELSFELPDMPEDGVPRAAGSRPLTDFSHGFTAPQPPAAVPPAASASRVSSVAQTMPLPQAAPAPSAIASAPAQPAPQALATIQAQLAPQAVPSVPVILDVLPHSLGIGTVGGYCEELVRRNTRVPTAVARVFSTSKDDQRTVRIRVSQGESRRLDDNVILGDLVLDGLQPRPRGQTQIEVTFDIDASGIVRVRATDRLTGVAQQADLQLTGAPTAEEVQAAADRVRRLRSNSA